TVVMAMRLIRLAVLRPIGILKEVKCEVAPCAPGGMTHVLLLLARALRTRRGLIAWAPYHTLVGIVRPPPGGRQVATRGLRDSGFSTAEQDRSSRDLPGIFPVSGPFLDS